MFDLIHVRILIVILGLAIISSCCDKDEDEPACMECELEPNVGPCNAAFPRYFFDKNEKICKEFIWGGCEGVVPFETMEECILCECN